MVRALCCLHNFLIDEKAPVSTSKDRFHIISIGGKPITEGNSHDVGDITGGGDHYDDSSRISREIHARTLFKQFLEKPRENMLEKLNLLGCVSRPKPMGSTSTNNDNVT